MKHLLYIFTSTMKLVLFSLVAPILADVSINLQDYTQYFSLFEEFAGTALIPPDIVLFISQIQTYTDDSYSTLLSQELLSDIATFVTGNSIFTVIPNYGSLIEGIEAQTTGGTESESVTTITDDTTTEGSGTETTADATSTETTVESTTSAATSLAESASAALTNNSSNGANVKLASLGGIVGVIGLLML